MSRRSNNLLPPLYRFLDTDFDGTGTKQAIGDYTTPTDFGIAPASNQRFELARMMVQVRDSGAGSLAADAYGFLAALSNGISLLVLDANDATITDLTDGIPITSHGEWAAFCFDADPKAFPAAGVTDEFFQARWTFDKAGQPLVIRGDLGEKFVARMRDNLTGLLTHTLQVQGKILFDTADY